MPSCNRAAILLLSGTLAVMNGACSDISSSSSPNKPSPSVAVSVTPTPAAKATKSKPATTSTNKPTLAAKDTYERGLDAAYSAALLGQSAVSADDWQLAIVRWQEAIALLRKVPSSSAFYALAKPKIAQYQRNLSIAQQHATLPRPSTPSGSAIATLPKPIAQPISPSSTETDTPPAPTTQSKTNTANPGVFKVPIKRRAGRTPVLEVTFNGGQVFEMILDTGASGTVITQEMAQSLGVVPEGEVTADTASGKAIKFATGRVRSIAVPGVVAKNVRVAIGGDSLELGLLGQDFFANYDVWIRQDVVEFHRR